MKSPKASSESISRSMRSNKSSETKPELIMSKLLKKKLFRKKIPGNPDFVYRKEKVAVFIHGCFWHRCPRCKLRLPKSNRDYWKKKFDMNIKRDITNRRKLKYLGWRVLEIWEHEIKSDPSSAFVKIKSKLSRTS